MASATVVASGAWTDFSTFTEKLVTLSQLVAVGHRAIFLHTTTVDGGVAPNAAGWCALVDPLYDTCGNTWTRDAFNVIDAVDTFVTTEVWSTFVGPTTALPTSGFGLNCNVVRGISSQWCLLDVSGLAENNGVSPLDQYAAANQITATAWATPAITLAQADELVFGVFGSPVLQTSSWFTDTAGFTSLHQQSNASDGSNQSFAVVSKEFVSGGSAQSTGTVPTSQTGNGVIVAYKVAAAVPVALPPINQAQSVVGQTASGTSLAVTLPNPTVAGNAILVTATVWKSGGADAAAALADNNGNTFVRAQTTAPATAAGARVYAWICKNTSAKSGHQLTVSTNAAAEITIEATEWTGADGTQFVASTKAGPTTSATVTAGAVTAPAGSLVYQVSTEDLGTTFINQQGWAKTSDLAVNQDIHTQWANNVSGSQNPSQTMVGGSTSWAAINVAVGPLSTSQSRPVRIPNPRVGPMALRHIFQGRRPQLLSSPSSTTSAVSATVAAIIEALQGVLSTAVDPVDAAAGISATASDPVEATQGVTGSTVEPLDAAGGVAQTLTDPVEALQGIAASGATDPVESAQGVASTQTGQLDAAQALAAATSAVVETLGSVTTSAVDQLDASQGVAATTGSAVVEALNGLAATLTGPLEATGGITSTAASILEALQGVAATGSDPLDAQGNTPVTATTAAVIEALQAISVPATGALDTVQTLTSTRQTAVESLATALATAGVPLEAAQAVAAAASVLPIETVAAVAITSQLPVEALQIVRAAVSAPLEAVAATLSGAEVPGSVSLSAAPFATVVLLARAFAELALTASVAADVTITSRNG